MSHISFDQNFSSLFSWSLDISFTISDDRVGYIKDRARAYSIQTYLWRRS